METGGFSDVLQASESKESEREQSSTPTQTQKVGQEQIHGLLFGDKLSWQAIIYDLINTEQLNPWDIDLTLLSQKFLEKVRTLEEANFFVSSKVLLAAALLLRMKSEILLEDDIKSLDDVLFGKKEERKYVQERIELEEQIPGLVVKTPLPRFKKVTLDELMSALGKAITTENRRIKKVVVAKQQEFETAIAFPKKRINLQDKIKEVHSRLQSLFAEREKKLAFSELAGKEIEERAATFVPLLHLDNQQKIWLEQEGHFSEIWILLKELYNKQNAAMLEQMQREVEVELKRLQIEEAEEQAIILAKEQKGKKSRKQKKTDGNAEETEEAGEDSDYAEEETDNNLPEKMSVFDRVSHFSSDNAPSDVSSSLTDSDDE